MYHKIDKHGRLWVYPDANLPNTEADVKAYLSDAGFGEVQPEEVGALTSGFLCSDDEDLDHPDTRIWWHEAYQVEDMAEAVRAGGLMLAKGGQS